MEISIENFAIAIQHDQPVYCTRRNQCYLNNPTGRYNLPGWKAFELKDKPVAQFYLDSAMVFTPEVSTSMSFINKISTYLLLWGQLTWTRPCRIVVPILMPR